MALKRNIGKLAAFSLILGCFTISAFGSGATNILFIIALTFSVLSCQLRVFLDLLRTNSIASASLLLFIYLGISSYWSSKGIENLLYLVKYKEFILIPFFINIFSNGEYRILGAKALFLGMLVYLIANYIQYSGIVSLYFRHYGPEDHIFSGCAISFFSYWCLISSRTHNSYFFLLLVIACGYDIFVIHSGRTGYVIFSSLVILFSIQTFNWKYLISIFSLFVCISWLFFKYSDFGESVFLLNDLSPQMIMDHLYRTDLRANFYVNTLSIIRDHWLFGVGLGDFEMVYSAYFDKDVYRLTSNPHNEFLMIWSQSGFFGLMSFVCFLWAVLRSRNLHDRENSDLVLGCFLTIFISCLFNSSFLDLKLGSLSVALLVVFCHSTKEQTKKM